MKIIAYPNLPLIHQNDGSYASSVPTPDNVVHAVAHEPYVIVDGKQAAASIIFLCDDD